MSIKRHEQYMRKAFQEAECAFGEDEVPVGAVIVHDSRIIAKAHNQVQRLCDPTAHAEMIAITQATEFLKSKWLQDCILYVTVEPCCMCAGALILARIGKIVFGVHDPKTGAFGSRLNINSLRLNHRIRVKGGILEKECGQLLKEFFKSKRAKTASHIY
ncbi:MAG: nucleoside deaminase [Candidatus Omnitrophota bacterium]|nr:MAG: nucleoside deaminase [Candidatus Omnitrophota bacterium]